MDVHIKQGYALNLCKKLRKDFEFVHSTATITAVTFTQTIRHD